MPFENDAGLRADSSSRNSRWALNWPAGTGCTAGVYAQTRVHCTAPPSQVVGPRLRLRRAWGKDTTRQKVDRRRHRGAARRCLRLTWCKDTAVAGQVSRGGRGLPTSLGGDLRPRGPDIWDGRPLRPDCRDPPVPPTASGSVVARPGGHQGIGTATRSIGRSWALEGSVRQARA